LDHQWEWAADWASCVYIGFHAANQKTIGVVHLNIVHAKNVAIVAVGGTAPGKAAQWQLAIIVGAVIQGHREGRVGAGGTRDTADDSTSNGVEVWNARSTSSVTCLATSNGVVGAEDGSWVAPSALAAGNAGLTFVNATT
jgi:hypothetical protein